MTEPSRQAPGRRRRKLRAVSKKLDVELGPDRSRTVHTFSDGWRVVRVARLPDQVREGTLMGNCLADLGVVDPNVWSLRDVDNLPHCTFALWRLGDPDDLDVLRYAQASLDAQLVVTSRVLAIPDRTRIIKPAHRARLQAFADAATLSTPVAPPLPSGNARRTILAETAGVATELLPQTAAVVWWLEAARTDWAKRASRAGVDARQPRPLQGWGWTTTRYPVDRCAQSARAPSGKPVRIPEL